MYVALIEQFRLNRVAALEAAVRFHESVGDLELRCGEAADTTISRGELAVRETAATFLAWLNGSTSISLIAGPTINQDTGRISDPPILTGDNMAQIHDNENTSFTVKTKDNKGFETADAITWQIAPDDGSIITWSTSEDGKTINVVSVAPGTVTGTVTDTQAFGPDGVTPLSASFTIDVLVGGTATIDVEQGPVTVQ